MKIFNLKICQQTFQNIERFNSARQSFELTFIRLSYVNKSENEMTGKDV